MALSKDATLVAQDLLHRIKEDGTQHVAYSPANVKLVSLQQYEIEAALDELSRIPGILIAHIATGLGTPDVYDVRASHKVLTELIGSESEKHVARFKLDEVRASITPPGGKEILLGKSAGDKSYQYWIYYHCTKKPGKPIQDIRILDSHAKLYGEQSKSLTKSPS